jgi:PhnB protein
VIPYLIVPDARRQIDFLTGVFGATLIQRHDTPAGDVQHAEVRIGESMIMIGSAGGQWAPVPAAINLYTENVDTTYQRALAAGATSVTAPTDQFYGDRSATVKDMNGNTWFITTHVEDVSAEEISRRFRIELDKRAQTGAART